MSKASETLLALAKLNSWRRGDETLEMPPPEEIGATIDDAVNLLRRHDEIERENARLREALVMAEPYVPHHEFCETRKMVESALANNELRNAHGDAASPTL